MGNSPSRPGTSRAGGGGGGSTPSVAAAATPAAAASGTPPTTKKAGRDKFKSLTLDIANDSTQDVTSPAAKPAAATTTTTTTTAGKPTKAPAAEDDEVDDDDDEVPQTPLSPPAWLEEAMTPLVEGEPIKLLTKQEALLLEVEVMKGTQELLDVSLVTAGTLLQFFNWDRDKLVERYLEKPEAICKDAGVVYPPPVSASTAAAAKAAAAAKPAEAAAAPNADAAAASTTSGGDTKSEAELATAAAPKQKKKRQAPPLPADSELFPPFGDDDREPFNGALTRGANAAAGSSQTAAQPRPATAQQQQQQPSRAPAAAAAAPARAVALTDVNPLFAPTRNAAPPPPAAPPAPAAPPTRRTNLDVTTLAAIALVQEVFPHLGEGYILACLRASSNRAENVITALLDGNAPRQARRWNESTTLEQFDRSLIVTTPAPAAAPTPATSAAAPPAPTPTPQLLGQVVVVTPTTTNPVAQAPRPPRYALAMFDYHATAADELSVTEGRYYVVLDSGLDSWWTIRGLDRSSTAGLCPSNYLQPIDPPAGLIAEEQPAATTAAATATTAAASVVPEAAPAPPALTSAAPVPPAAESDASGSSSSSSSSNSSSSNRASTVEVPASPAAATTTVTPTTTTTAAAAAATTTTTTTTTTSTVAAAKDDSDEWEPEEEETCSVCYCDCPQSQIVPGPCGHRFCTDCWQGHLKAKLGLGADAIYARCMNPSCDIVLDMATWRRLASSEDYRKYEWFFLKAFVEKNPNAKWCPNPSSCKYAIYYSGRGSRPRGLEVTCVCHYEMCFDCGGSVHRPATCEQLEQWGEKLKSSDAMSAQWIAKNTKRCPQCKSAIEKNEGCMHMTCRSCAHQFCWLCLGPWSQHGSHTGGYYNCNKYDPAKHDQQDAAAAAGGTDSAAFSKFVHFWDRYNFHSSALQRTRDTIQQQVDRRIKATAEQLVTKFGADAGMDNPALIFQDALRLLIRCRTVLRNSYIFAYFVNEAATGKKKTTEKEREADLFNFVQGDLEQSTEVLAGTLNNAASTPSQLRPMVQATRRYLNNMLEAMESGLLSEFIGWKPKSIQHSAPASAVATGAKATRKPLLKRFLGGRATDIAVAGDAPRRVSTAEPGVIEWTPFAANAIRHAELEALLRLGTEGTGERVYLIRSQTGTGMVTGWATAAAVVLLLDDSAQAVTGTDTPIEGLSDRARCVWRPPVGNSLPRGAVIVGTSSDNRAIYCCKVRLADDTEVLGRLIHSPTAAPVAPLVAAYATDPRHPVMQQRAVHLVLCAP